MPIESVFRASARWFAAVSLASALAACSPAPAPQEPADAQASTDVTSAVDVAAPPADVAIAVDAQPQDASAASDAAAADAGDAALAERDAIINGRSYSCVLSPPGRTMTPEGVLVTMIDGASYDCYLPSQARVNCRCVGLGAPVTVTCPGATCAGCCMRHSYNDPSTM